MIYEPYWHLDAHFFKDDETKTYSVQLVFASPAGKMEIQHDGLVSLEAAQKLARNYVNFKVTEYKK